MGIKSLIVGTNGFLAFHLAKILSKSENISGIYHSHFNTEIASFYQCLYHESEIEKMHNEYDFVYILASYIPYGKMNEGDLGIIKSNIDLVSRIVKHFSASRIIFASSISVYGASNGLIIHEKSPFNQPNLYGLSKIAGECIVQNHRNFGIIRFSSLYGKGMNKSTFLPKIIENAIINKKILLLGDGARKQDYFHVEDAAKICQTVALSDQNGIFLGVQGHSLSNLEVAQVIQMHLPSTKIELFGNDLSESYSYDNEFTKKMLNFLPTQNFSTTIKLLLADGNI